MAASGQPIPAGGAGAPAPAGMNEEEGELPTEVWVKQVKKDITTKPIFLIATHGSYDKRALMAPPSKVPDGCLILELTSLGDILSGKCAIIGTPLYTLLGFPESVVTVILEDPGSPYEHPDIELLHSSAKYIAGEEYYERKLTLSEEDLSGNGERHFFIHKFYRNKFGNPIVQKQTELMNILISKSKIGAVYTNNLIRYIQETDTDVKNAGGCVCLFATCGTIDDPIYTPLYDTRHATFQKHALQYKIPNEFQFPSINKNRTTKDTKLLVFDPTSASHRVNVLPEEVFAPLNVSNPYVTGQKMNNTENIHTTRQKMVGNEEYPPHPPKHVYPPAPSRLTNFPRNMRNNTGFIIGGKSYYLTKRTIGANGKPRVAHIVKFSGKEARRIFATLKRKYATMRKQGENTPFSVQILYRGKWIPIELETGTRRITRTQTHANRKGINTRRKPK